ncbi:MAG: 2-hydroxyacyl-CoA dehydratase, partial [bacterium]|nr:2-hydroxyacyl-CoA dehydratase [bacterium]
LRESLEEVGIPLLVLDGDCIDPTIDPCSTYTKVQSYVEVLNDKKFNNIFGSTSVPQFARGCTTCAQ